MPTIPNRLPTRPSRQAEHAAATAAEAAAALAGPVLEIAAFRFAAKPHRLFSSPPQCLSAA